MRFVLSSLFFGLFVISASGSFVHIIGEVDDASNPSMNPISNFLETTIIPPNNPQPFYREMVVLPDFLNTFGLTSLPESETFTRDQVQQLAQGQFRDVLSVLDYENLKVFNGSQMIEILARIQDPRYTPSEGHQMCYCHRLSNAHKEKGRGLFESEAEPEYYAAIWVGGYKTVYSSDSDSGPSYISSDKGDVYSNPIHESPEERICLNSTSTASISPQFDHSKGFICQDCCLRSMTTDGYKKSNPKIWGNFGCPKIDSRSEECTLPSLLHSHYSFHYHLRNLESLKMYSIMTRSRDMSSYCNHFVKSLPKIHTSGELIDKDCEQQVATYVSLAKGELDFMNPYEIALLACQMDGKCVDEIGMKAVWFHFSGGDRCAMCLARSYTAAIDYYILEFNSADIDMDLFCKAENSIHPYISHLSSTGCKDIEKSFHANSGAVMRTALDVCSHQCTYTSTSKKLEDKEANLSDNLLLADLNDPVFWESVEL